MLSTSQKIVELKKSVVSLLELRQKSIPFVAKVSILIFQQRKTATGLECLIRQFSLWPVSVQFSNILIRITYHFCLWHLSFSKAKITDVRLRKGRFPGNIQRNQLQIMGGNGLDFTTNQWLFWEKQRKES